MDYAADWASRTGQKADPNTGMRLAVAQPLAPLSPDEEATQQPGYGPDVAALNRQKALYANDPKRLAVLNSVNTAPSAAPQQTDYAADWAARAANPAPSAPVPKADVTPSPAAVSQPNTDQGLWGDLSRQVGLTARAGLNAVGGTVGMFTNPVDMLLHKITGIQPTTAEQFTSQIADSLGLPQPKNATERVAGAVASGMASAGGITGLANAGANAVTGVGKAVLSALGTSPGMAVTSGGGAGAGGQIAQESGAGPIWRTAAAVAGGVIAPTVAGAVMRGLPAIWNKATEAAANEKALWSGKGQTPAAEPTSGAPSPAIQALQNQGIEPASIPTRALTQIKQDVDAATKAGAPIAEDQIARVARAAKWNTQLTAAQITQDPALAQAEFNNEGLASAGKSIRDFKMANERGFMGAINDKIGSYQPTASDTVGTAEKTIGTLAKIDQGLKANVDDAYTVARSMVGNNTPVPLQPVASKLGQLYEEEGINQLGVPVVSFLKKRGLLDASGAPAGTQTQTFTVQDADLLRKVMNRNPAPVTDPAALRTQGELRSAVNDAEGALADSPDQIGTAAAKAFAAARQAHAARMTLQEQVPALKAASQGADPEKFMQSYLYGNNKTATVENTQNLMDLLNKTGQTQTTNEIRADVGRQIKTAIQPRGQWQSDAPLSGDAAVKMLNNPVMQRKLQAVMGPDAADWNDAAQVASDLKFIPSRTHAQVSGNYAAIGSLLEKMENKPASGTLGTLAEIGKGTPLVGPYVNRIAQSASIRSQQNAADRFISEVTSGRIPVNAGGAAVGGSRVPVGVLLGTQQLTGAPPRKNNERNQNAR